jgi:hypothetical protein
MGSIDDRAQGKLGLPWDTNLPHKDDIERRLKRFGHFKSHWHAPARQRQNHRMLGLKMDERTCELSASAHAIPKIFTPMRGCLAERMKDLHVALTA